MEEEKQTQKKRNKLSNIEVVLWLVLSVALLFSLAAEMFVPEHEVIYGVEGKKFFFAGYGFISCFAIIIFSKIVGVFLKRKENYYREIRHDE